jgi:anaerobic selenocysteine-containing dehydrogenase
LTDDIGWEGQILDPPIKCLFVYNSDPANCVPNSGNMRRGMMRDDLFTVVHDTMWTDSCDYADIVLPADTQFERTDFHGAYGYYHYAMNRPVIAPLGESVSNAELFRRLARHMGYIDSSDNAFTQTDEEIIREHFLDGSKNALVDGITFDHLIENGWALANYDHPARRYLELGWPTADGKIQIWSDALAAEGVDPLPAHVAEFEGQEDPLRARFPLQVLSTASHYFIGDSFQTVERLRAMHSRPTFEINDEEAARRSIADGDFCRLYNDRGETFGHALILHGMLPGVIGTQKQLKGSATAGGVNVNALNTEVLTDFGYAPSFYSVLAEIEKVGDDALDGIKLKGFGGWAGYLRRWRADNPGLEWDDDAILAELRATHPGLFAG